MQVYDYNPSTGEYLGIGIAQKSPLEPGIYLIPANATSDAPPPTEINEVAVFRNKTWQIIPDYRGQEACEIDAEGFYIRKHEFQLGEAPGVTIILSKRPEGFYKPKWVMSQWTEGLTQIEVDAINIEKEKQLIQNQLNELDKVLPRCVEDLIITIGINNASLPQIIQDRLLTKQQLRTQINQLV